MPKNGKSANCNENQTRKNRRFLAKKKKRKTDLINSQNRKIENPNAPPPLVLFLRKSIDKPSNVRLMLIRFLS